MHTQASALASLLAQKSDDVIEVEIELDELDLTSAESKATYAEIKDYVLKEHGLKVSNLYISQVKNAIKKDCVRKCGIEVGENYNLPKSEDSRQPQCPEEKEKAIKDALEHFGMIYRGE
jgi:23S rRNA (uracil1939-C5)-methyltransferase